MLPQSTYGRFECNHEELRGSDEFERFRMMSRLADDAIFAPRVTGERRLRNPNVLLLAPVTVLLPGTGQIQHVALQD